MPVPTALERVGHVLAERYLLEELLARGGMGVLYLGRHLLTGRRVAVKVMRPEEDADTEAGALEAERFLREARLAAALEHPHVVQIFDMGVDGAGSWFLVMELLEGESLADYLTREGPLTPERTLELLLPVMGALAIAHDQGVVHRDVKPDNIFLARRGPRLVPTLLDFGIAKHLEAGTLTERGMAIGTPMYMSPEQAAGDSELGPQSDVWSMGVLFYHCLTGELPFEAPTPASVLVRILSEPAPRLELTATHVPSPLAATVDRALLSSLDARYPNMRGFACALVQASLGVVPLPDDPEPLGLPHFREWAGAAPVDLPPLPSNDEHALADAAEPPSRSGLRRSSNPPSMPARRAVWGALILLTMAAGFVAWRYWIAPGPAEVPVAGPPVPVPSAPPAAAPATGSTKAADPPAAELPPEGPAAETPRPPRSPPASSKPKRRPRQRPRAKPAPALSSTPRQVAPASAPAEDADPFRIRRDYRNE